MTHLHPPEDPHHFLHPSEKYPEWDLMPWPSTFLARISLMKKILEQHLSANGLDCFVLATVSDGMLMFTARYRVVKGSVPSSSDLILELRHCFGFDVELESSDCVRELTLAFEPFIQKAKTER